MHRILLLPQQIMPGYFTSGSYIRLIHPYQRLADARGEIRLTVRESYDDMDYDCVVIERIYREDCTPDEITELIRILRKKGAKIVFTIDDDYFDYFIENVEGEKTLRQLSTVCLIARQADAVICSTQSLADILENYNSKVYLFNNYLSRQYLKLSPATSKHRSSNGSVDIGYMGTLTHLSDFHIVTNAIKAILSEYSNVRLHLIQIAEEADLRKALDPYNAIIHKAPHLSCLYEVFFPWFVKNIRWDIGLAPLANTALNRCKSDLKLLDYAAIGAAGIYSRITPYKDIERNGRGIVVNNSDEDWYFGIKKLVDDFELRYSLQEKAQEYLMQERVLEDNIHKLGTIMNAIL